MAAETLNGKWKLNSSDKFDEYMKALGEIFRICISMQFENIFNTYRLLNRCWNGAP